jgi:predicted O-methyltransferase YrrM
MGRGPKQDYAVGSSQTNPFNPPRQMNAAANSLVGMLQQIQRRRNERQRMAEIGVWQGVSSRWLLNCMPWLHMTLVDPFVTGGTPENPDWKDSFAGCPQEQIDRQYELVRDLCRQFPARTNLLRLMSTDAALLLPDGSLDLVFIDGDHSYDGVCKDIAAWRSKVRPGGFLCGHDYKPTGVGHYGQNVGRAVDEFRDATGWTLEVRLGKVWAFLVPQS